MKKTKIIATLGPASQSEEKLTELYNAGVNIIRFNFSHAVYDNAKENKNKISKLNSAGLTKLSCLLDTKGPEIRTGDLSEKILFSKGDLIDIYTDLEKSEKAEKSLFCDYMYLVEDLNVGDFIEIDSGLLKVKVVSKSTDFVTVEAGSDCLIGSRRHINLPGKSLRLPGITDKDKQDVLFGIENDFDFIAQSFVRSKENVLELRKFLDDNNGSHIKIISKIENQEGIDNLDDIIEVSDGIMVARGDLGIEVPIESLPIYQRRMVKKCLESGKFVIVATQLIESMIENPFPTRAEISDIFNSVMQKADCLMLSGETAIGKYPVEAVTMMKNVIVEAEKQIIYKHNDFLNNGLSQRNIEKKLLIKSALFMADELNVDAILIFTRTGLLARLASAFRPNKDVYAFTGKKASLKYMNILFGIKPTLLKDWSDSYVTNLKNSINILLEQGKIDENSKLIAITDIQIENKEIPVLEIITIKDYI
ncbi:MAG: pyruvate kinase [Candidatus Gracilibacteria bacterium]|nr:pyruvate kinase [Candidatus Gracilibacteria bacterium]